MDKLFLPKGAVIQGERIAVSHEGDIQIENNLVPLSIKSQNGSIVFIPESQHVNCSHLLAENGQISLHAESVDAELISAKEVTLHVDSLEVSQAIQAQEKLDLDGKSLKVGDINAGSLILNIKGALEVGTIDVVGDLVISAGTLKANQVKAAKIKLDIGGKLECERLIAESDVEVVNGSIAVKYLDCQQFNASPRVTGIILVATPEHVKAEGVRGFIRPQEFQAFSSNESFLQLGSGSENEGTPQSASEKTSAASHEPEVMEPEDDEPAPLNATYETLDVEEMDNAHSFEGDESISTDQLEDDPPELPQDAFGEPPPAPGFQEDESPSPPPLPDTGTGSGSESTDQESVEEENEDPQSLDDIAMETLNIDDDVDGDNFEDDEKAIDMDTISEDQAFSMDDASLDAVTEADEKAESLDNLDALSYDEELEMDSINLEPEEPETSDWPGDTAFPLNEEGALIPEESDEFKTTELNFPETDAVEISDDYGVEDLSFGPNSFNLDEIQEPGPTPDFDSAELLDDAESLSENSNEGLSEDQLVANLEATIGEIKGCFPDDNFPKFISQIEVYLQERRFQILRKKRNREAVISSFDRLSNPKVSDLARKFYEELTTFFNDEM